MKTTKTHKLLLITCLLVLTLNVVTLIIKWPSPMMTVSTALAAISVLIAVLVLKIDKLKE
jgi:hypothetical protein